MRACFTSHRANRLRRERIHIDPVVVILVIRYVRNALDDVRTICRDQIAHVRGNRRHCIQDRKRHARLVQGQDEVRNISESNVVLMVGAPQTDFTQSVIGPDGNTAPATPLGAKLRSVVPNGSHVMITLPPQETVSSTWTLSDLVDFSKSGRYRVTVSRHFDNINETDASNSIDIDIP